MNKLDKKLENFSGSILVARANKLVLYRSYGLKNIEENIENTNNTSYPIGSISKIFTALAIMKLHENGCLDINEPAKKYLQIEELDEDIKIRHLLNHSSGLKNFVLCRKTFNLYEDNRPEEIAQKISAMKRNFKAGERLAYNNTGYLMLALIVEKVSKSSFEAYIEENIFLKLDMKDSSFLSRKRLDIAKGYKNNRARKPFHPSSFWGCGDIISTTGDLNKLIVAINSGKIISRNLVEDMQKIQAKNIILKYGYGFMLENRSGQKSIGHSGSIPNSYGSKLSYYPNRDLVIIVLSNNIKSINRFIAGPMAIPYIEKYLYRLYS